MKLISFYLVLALIVGGATAGSAHMPAAGQDLFYCFHFPLHAIPTIDGDLSDWDIVPRDIFEISLERGHIVEVVRGDAGDDLADFNARNMFGWNKETNRVYAMAEVVDDFLHNMRDDPSSYNYDDDIHLIIDADHSGGPIFEDAWNDLPEAERRELFYTTGQLYQIHVPPIDGYWAFMYIEGTHWLTTGRELPYPEYLEIGWTRTGETGGPGTYTYELKVTPWEFLSWYGPGQSTIVPLQENRIIHLAVIYKDYDLNPGRYDGAYDFPPFHNSWRNADLMADFLLLPVDTELFPSAVETDTWGRIKSRFILDE